MVLLIAGIASCVLGVVASIVLRAMAKVSLIDDDEETRELEESVAQVSWPFGDGKNGAGRRRCTALLLSGATARRQGVPLLLILQIKAARNAEKKRREMMAAAKGGGDWRAPAEGSDDEDLMEAGHLLPHQPDGAPAARSRPPKASKQPPSLDTSLSKDDSARLIFGDSDKGLAAEMRALGTRVPMLEGLPPIAGASSTAQTTKGNAPTKAMGKSPSTKETSQKVLQVREERPPSPWTLLRSIPTLSCGLCLTVFSSVFCLSGTVSGRPDGLEAV